jgi:hypothetical protein
MTLFACHNQQTEKPKENSAFPKAYAREPNDSVDYKHIKYDFYFNKTGQLCERKLAMARDSYCNCEFEVYYDSTISFFTGDTTIRKPLSSVIDINTFVWIDSTEYSKDKNGVYYFFGNSDGGNRSIVEGADPKTFKRLCEYRWGVDKNHVFYQNKKLEGLNLNKLQVLYSPDTSDHFVEYVKDDKHVYHADEVLQGADAKTFKVVSGQKWQAEDKNSKYGQSL